MKFQKIQIKRCRLDRFFIVLLIIMVTSFSADNWKYQGSIRNDRVKINRKIVNNPNDEINQNLNNRSLLASSINSLQYETHEPITIDGNSDFLTQAASENWPGDGSEGNPIIIDSLNITGEKCFIITNTDLFFNLSNCVITCPESNPNYVPTLFFNNIRNGNIFNNILTGGGESVLQMSSSDTATINNNSITSSIGGTGIEILGSTNINIIYNIVSDNDLIGILVSYGSSNIFIGRNIVQNNGYIGIHLEGETDSNRIIANNITNNLDYGILIERPSSNTEILWNNFLDNNPGGISQASDSASSNRFERNHWNEWISPDTNTDGIVDKYYPIMGEWVLGENRDFYPLVYLYSPHIITEPTIIYPTGGETLNGTIEVQWTPSNDSSSHSVTYSVFYSADNGDSWNILISRLNSTNYDWDSTTSSDGAHCRIKVIVSCAYGSIFEYISEEFMILNGLSPPIIVFPSSGVVLAGIVSIQWQPSIDVIGMNVTYTIEISNNNGTTWIPLISDLTTNSYRWDTTTVRDGSKYLIKVEENYPGGIKVTAISDGTFTIENMPSLITTIILPILVAIVLLGMLFWINRQIFRIIEEKMTANKEL
ncbi:MAG: right-handed parallel beta-helix repeat-containing protein [Candidatus Hodarchaeales archaeon]|jgi:parallel beta-helix repeat protein